MDPFTETPLIDPAGYTPDVDEYYSFLKNGIEQFKNRQN
jgi:hypothetical protein